MEQILGAMILAGGAFFGVWKGAVYAAGRLGAQLAEERDRSDERLDAEAGRLQMQLDAQGVRLQKQLDAEAARLDRQLRHDRAMRDLEEARKKIDGVMIDMRRIAEIMNTLAGIVALDRRVDEGKEWQHIVRLREETIAGFSDLHRDLNDRVVSLYLRLRPNHPIVEASEAFLDIALEIIEIFREIDRKMGEEERTKFFALRDRLSVAQAGFMAASISFVGIQDLDIHSSESSGDV